MLTRTLPKDPVSEFVECRGVLDGEILVSTSCIDSEKVRHVLSIDDRESVDSVVVDGR